MKPLLQSFNDRTRATLRAVTQMGAAALCMAAVTTSAYAMPTPEARNSLNGLETVDFGQSIRDQLVRAGLKAVGTPYAWGGNDPDGFDCSGLTAFVYREIASLELPRRARDQRSEGKKVSRPELEPGDLVFFATTRRRNVVSHVGIYIGDNQFVHAPSRGSTVRVDSMTSEYWSKRYSGARAYVAPEELNAFSTLVAHN